MPVTTILFIFISLNHICGERFAVSREAMSALLPDASMTGGTRFTLARSPHASSLLVQNAPG